jgi:hypothetical protein
MRFLRLLFIALGLMVGLPLGGLLLYATVELRTVAQKTQPTPQGLAAVELAAKGAPENLYVELTGFMFGEPIIEKNKEGWEFAWLPVEPALEPEEALKHVIFLRANVRDQAALDRFRKQTRFEALVTTGLPKSSRWRAKSSSALRKAYPDLDMSQAVFLAEPRLMLLGYAVELSDPRLHDPTYESIGAWSGGALLLFGLVSVYWLIRGRRAPQDATASEPDAAARRAQLETERPESVHTARASGVFGGILGYGVLAGILLFGLFLVTAAAFLAQRQGKPHIAVMLALLDLPVFLGAQAAWRACRRMRRWPTDIALCPSGVRWRQGRQRRVILWAEVAEIQREIKVIPRFRQTGLLGAMNELNNPTPPLIRDTLQITLLSGESYRMTPDLVSNYNKFAEAAKSLWKDDVLRRDNAGVTDAWLKSLPRGVGAALD